MRFRRICGLVFAGISIGICPVQEGRTESTPAVSFTPPKVRKEPIRATTPPVEVIKHARISQWRPIFLGVETCEGGARQPRPLQVRAVRVDLHEPTVQFLVTPSNGETPEKASARTTAEFLIEFKCQVAINGSYFHPWAKTKNQPLNVEGLALSRGHLYSPARKRDALLISRDNVAWVEKAPVKRIGQAYNGLGGEGLLLLDGRYVSKATRIASVLDPRTAVAISRDGRYLIVITVDGRQPGYSEGASREETAEWLRKFGGWNGINLDGGGSATLVIEGPDGQPVTLNKPCGPPVGAQRRVATHLGVFAKRLPNTR